MIKELLIILAVIALLILFTQPEPKVGSEASPEESGEIEEKEDFYGGMWGGYGHGYGYPWGWRSGAWGWGYPWIYPSYYNYWW
jgi:hypothetical protein